MSIIDKEYITPMEASNVFSVEYHTIWRWMKVEKILPYYQLTPRKILLKKTELEEFMQSHKVDFQAMKKTCIN